MSNFSRRKAIAIGTAGVAGIAATVANNSPVKAQTESLSQPPVNSDGRFANKIVLITGATSGIGEATARAFAAEGAIVHFCGRREQLGQQVAQSIVDAGGKATYQKADVRIEDEVKNFVDSCVQRYGKIDVAFNNAGIVNPQAVPLAEQSLEDWQNVMTTNTTGYFLSMKYEIPNLLKNEPWGKYGTRGVIVNNASVSAHIGFPGISPYSSSKHAVVGMTKCAALEYGEQGLRINSISPGAVNTPISEKVVLITGATSGMGETAARAFAMEGAIVHFCGRRENLGNQIAQSIETSGGKASYQKADVRVEQEVKAFVNGCLERYGRVDIAFNNAGIDRPPAPLADTTTEVWDDIMNTNARGIFLAMKYEIPQMLKQKSGIIVNMSSIGGHRVFPGISPYHASKYAVEAMTKGAAKEYAEQNIRVNAIAPGLVETAMMERVVRDWNVTREELASGYPANRISTPEEQLRVVMFMCSPEASYMTGAIVSVDGGGWG